MLNLGANRPTELMRYIEVLEEKLGKKAVIEFLPMQPGDVAATEADTAETRAVAPAPQLHAYRSSSPCPALRNADLRRGGAGEEGDDAG